MIRRVAAVTLGFAALALIGTGDGLVLVHHLQHGPHGYAYWLEGTTAVVTWTLVGLLLAVRLPGNPLGWLALGFAVVGSMQDLTGALGVQLRDSGVGHGTVNALAALSAFCQLTSVGSMVLAAQLVPTGRPVGRRWRLFIGLTVVAIFVAGVKNVLSDAGVNSLVAGARSPFGSMRHVVVTSFDAANALLVVCLAPAVASVVVRWRSGSSTERQQLKWIVFAVVTAVLLAVVVTPIGDALLPGTPWIGSVMWAVIGASLPVGTGVAILRYRLYDIDRIVSRTVSYALVSGVLIGVYVGVVAVTTELLPFSSSFGVAASTLAAAALFQPLRRRVQSSVDRRFSRATYDARRTVETFTARLRDQVDLDVVRSDLVNAVSRSVAPAHVSLWVTT